MRRLKKSFAMAVPKRKPVDLAAKRSHYFRHYWQSSIKEGTAQNQIIVYGMYTRFFRWASDRLGPNGIIAFITNRSFIDSKTFDGFRKCIEREFDYIYIVDTQSDMRNNPKISGTKNNVFGIQTGIAVMFLVKTNKEKGKRLNL